MTRPDRDWPTLARTTLDGGAFDALRRICTSGTNRRERRPSLASVSKQAAKAKIAVARYEIKPDGTVVIITNKPGEPEQGKEFDQWLAKKKANNADQS
jgi:hypothetical protein